MQDAIDETYQTSGFLKFYFYLLAASIVLVLLVEDNLLKDGIVDVFQWLFTIVALVAFWGYVYKKKILTRQTWLVFVPLFFVWELGCYVFIENPIWINLLILITLLPKYWSVALYPLITFEPNDEKRKANIAKRDRYTSKYRPAFIGLAALATVALVLTCIGLIASRFLE